MSTKGMVLLPGIPEIEKSAETLAVVNMLWSYNPLTGVFVWKVQSNFHLNVGDVAGTSCRGRFMLKFRRRKYQSSHIAWLMMTGVWPEREVDHIDGDPSNNKWDNLRLATHGQNCRNQKLRKDNALGVKGVHPHGSGYRAAISFEGNRYSLGTFPTVAAARAAYEEASVRLHGEFRRAA